MDIIEDRLIVDESLKEMRLPVIEAAVLAVQGYINPLDDTSDLKEFLDTLEC